MRKNKFIYTLSALMMACIISFSGTSGSYIQVYATSVGIPRPSAWNDNASTWDNIRRYIDLYMAYQGVYTNPSNTLFTAQDFYDFMMDDGVSHDVAHGIFCDCDDSSHTSFTGQEHGGGGFVRDGITVDEDGNVTYSDEVSDLFHGYILNYLNNSCGYWLFKTPTPDQISVDYFSSKTEYDNFKASIDNLDVLGFKSMSSSGGIFLYIPTDHLYVSIAGEIETTATSILEVYNGESNPLQYYVLKDDWSYAKPYYLQNSSGDMRNLRFGTVYDWSKLFVSTTTYSPYYLYHMDLESNNFSTIVSKDGRTLKVWYDLDAFKRYDVGQQPYYVTQTWNSYNSADDNSITMTDNEYQYFTDNSSTMYQTVQNNIDNSSETVNETIVQNIVNNTYNQIIEDASKDDSGSDDSGNGSTSDNDSGGTGVGDLLTGIGKIFDTILSLIGKLMGVVADFTQSILDLFSGFTTFTDGFSQFLAGAFGFIPAEIWNVIQVGLSLMVLAAIIKFLRK